MKNETREFVRLQLLIVANRAPVGVSLDLARASMVTAGAGRLGDDEILREIDYLVDKSFLRKEPKPISPENKLWKITADGRDFLAEQKLD